VESADVGPTADATAASAKWEAAAKAALVKWEEVRSKGAASVNALLERAKLPPLKIH
jgi:hypothetical protein